MQLAGGDWRAGSKHCDHSQLTVGARDHIATMSGSDMATRACPAGMQVPPAACMAWQWQCRCPLIVAITSLHSKAGLLGQAPQTRPPQDPLEPAPHQQRPAAPCCRARFLPHPAALDMASARVEVPEGDSKAAPKLPYHEKAAAAAAAAPSVSNPAAVSQPPTRQGWAGKGRGRVVAGSTVEGKVGRDEWPHICSTPTEQVFQA